MAAIAPAVAILRIMMAILPGRVVDGRLRLGLEFDDLESKGIPAPHFGVSRGLDVGVLDGGHPIAEDLLSAGALAPDLRVANLGQIVDAARAREEADGLDLNAHRASVLVDIQRRGGV